LLVLKKWNKGGKDKKKLKW